MMYQKLKGIKSTFGNRSARVKQQRNHSLRFKEIREMSPDHLDQEVLRSISGLPVKK